MKLIVKNKSDDIYSYANGAIVINAYEELLINEQSWFLLYSDEAFIKDLTLNNFAISDGNTDYTGQSALDFIDKIHQVNFSNKDTDGASIVRIKAAKKGWSFWAVPIEITTSSLGTLFAQFHDGTNIPWISCKIYNENDEEITTPGLLNANLNTCVKTVIDFEPTFDYEIIGGALRVNSNPAQDIRMWIIGAPDIPTQFGGTKEFASGVNLKFLAQDSEFNVDGRVTKFLSYDEQTHSGKLRILLKHPAGLQVNIQFVIHLYRE